MPSRRTRCWTRHSVPPTCAMSCAIANWWSKHSCSSEAAHHAGGVRRIPLVLLAPGEGIPRRDQGGAARMRANPKFIGACGGGERRTRLRRRLPILLCFLVSTPAIPAWSASKKPVRAPLSAASEALEQARQALFIDSELDTAREQARIAIDSSAAVAERVKPRTPARRVELEARFIDMESAALQADYPAALEAALRLCELPGAARYDP